MKDARYLKLSQIKITLSLADSNVLVFGALVHDRLSAVYDDPGLSLALIVLFAAACGRHLPDRTWVAGAARSKADV
jgi:hypothetical protein